MSKKIRISLNENRKKKGYLVTHFSHFHINGAKNENGPQNGPRSQNAFHFKSTKLGSILR